MEEIGIPTVSLLPLIDISEMLNSPPSPICKTLYEVVGRLAGVQEGGCVQGGVRGKVTLCKGEGGSIYLKILERST
jgi:hypothetical protein